MITNKVGTTEQAWTKERARVLALRIASIQSLNATLPEASILRTMNDRALFAMECKLARLKRAGSPPAA